MALTIGSRLGSYEILSALGAGGMGEVYRARDIKLGRNVALKIIPETFALDSDRLARFKREAQVLASLNHPHIGAIYGFEDSGETHALVLELVEGETLADRIARGAIPLDEALPIAKQIAEALEAAHERGIIHRDLKPANIKITPDGVVKVLDFGLAKLAEPAGSGQPAAGSVPLSMSPTITSPAMMTGVGVILGTAAYMSPEQAKGREADKRSDIWAFGCVLYELLTGKRPFDGEDVSDTLANVLKREPDWTAMPVDVPPTLRALLRRCLEKDRRERVADLSTALFVLKEQTRLDAPISSSSNRGMWLVTAVATVALIAMAVMLMRRGVEITAGADPVQFTIAPPENTSFGGLASGGTGLATQVAISPDGRNIVFVAGSQSAYKIWLRPVAALEARPIAGTEGGAFPFWSPDSRFIGFFANGKLKKVQIAGGPPIVLGDAPSGRGGTWNGDNVILFAPSSETGTRLLRVSSGGGMPTVVTTLDPTTGETFHRWPNFLPDGNHFIYTASTGTCCPALKPSIIKIGSLDSADSPITLFQAESSVSYASGHLLFARDETLMAQAFDPVARQTRGDPFPLGEHVSTEGSRYAAVSISQNGTIVYGQSSSQTLGQLAWFDRVGRTLGTVGETAQYYNLTLSPDKGRVAVALGTGSPVNLDIWILDIVRNGRARVTVDPGADGSPVWSPDGSRIVFASQRSGKIALRQKLINGTAADEPLIDGDNAPSSWSADGQFIAYTNQGYFPLRSDIWALPLFGDRKPFPVVQTESVESSGMFSPDGRWIAYVTNEAGQPNVYVQPFPVAGRKYQVSLDGGDHPVWRADGKELFYLAVDGTMMAAPISATGEFDAGPPQALFRTTARRFSSSQMYDVTKDGMRFLINERPPQSSAAPLTVIVNWIAASAK